MALTTAQMIIASPLDFFDAGYMYEAILHRAPKVKNVTVRNDSYILPNIG